MIKEKVIEVFRRQFSSAELPDDCSELALGDIVEWDSLGNLNFLLAVEEEFGIRFTLEEMSNLKSLPEICKAVAKHHGG